MEYLFSKWIRNPDSVHKSWQLYFNDVLQSNHVGKVENFSSTATQITAEQTPNQDTLAKNSSVLFGAALDKLGDVNIYDLCAKLETAKAAKTVKETQKSKDNSDDVQITNQKTVFENVSDSVEKTIQKENSVGVTNQKEGSESSINSSNSSNDLAEMTTKPPSQEKSYVIGTIILSPINEDLTGSKDVKEEAKKPKDRDSIKIVSKPKRQQTNKSTSNKVHVEPKKPVELAEHLRAVERVKEALKEKPFCTRRDFIKSQLERIEKLKDQKFLDRKKREENVKIVAKTPKPEEKPRK
ncbi:uncharacterized protein Dvir_GJ12369 [Drosophila virilis]|uniref:2-oxoglutarate dehydrogenase E1 component N-terminal domain-containing protein n=1 Tax=Drosophila virilis TaxID=7244 RepID=A0A0Q9WV27_DROVI|nr:uncharacterized protein Dvir_GJ12369 [Drosophila virilis]